MAEYFKNIKYSYFEMEDGFTITLSREAYQKFLANKENPG